MLREDNSGFVNFPQDNRIFTKSGTGKTFIYLVAFDTQDIGNKPYELSNLRLNLPGELVTDDITSKKVHYQNLTLGEFVEEGKKSNDFQKMYFPNTIEDTQISQSIPLTSCICIGWSEFNYEFREDKSSWFATFKDLTHEGKKLYYSIKKLHNNKEVRILTFNNI